MVRELAREMTSEMVSEMTSKFTTESTSEATDLTREQITKLERTPANRLLSYNAMAFRRHNGDWVVVICLIRFPAEFGPFGCLVIRLFGCLGTV